MKWTERLKITRISRWAILLLTIAIIIFTLVTLYGLNVGNFVIGVENKNDRGDVTLALSVSGDPMSSLPRLSAQGLREQGDTTKAHIPDLDVITKGSGSKNDTLDQTYMAFSFFLHNKSAIAVDYEYTFKIEKADNDIFEVLRVWIIESNEEDIVTDDTVYMYNETPENWAKYEEEMDRLTQYDAYGNIIKDYRYDAELFINETDVCRVESTNFRPGGKRKYTVVLWAEGCDPKCTTDYKLIDETLRASMLFVGRAA